MLEVELFMCRNIMRSVCLVILICCVIILSSCTQIKGRYKYTLKFEFKDANDIAIIETRMKALQLNITETEHSEENVIIYDLNSHYSYSDEYLNLICMKEDVSITNNNGDVIIDRADVISVKYILTNIMVEVSDDFCQEFYDTCIAKTILFNHNDAQLSVDAITETIDGKSYITFILGPNSTFEDKLIFVSGAISLCSESINQIVSLQIIKSPN